MARPEKVATVEEIRDRFNEVDSALLTEYRGLSVSAIAEVRRALREVDADYKVFKNTLARLAVTEIGLDELVGMLEGPTAIAFVRGDAVDAAKALDAAAGKYPVLALKGGVLRGGRVIDADEAKRLAKIESREVLLTQVAIMANQPAQKLANVFSALLRDLGSMLVQVQSLKESGELASGSGSTPEPEAGGAEGDTHQPEGEPTPDGDEEGQEAEEEEK